MRYTKAQLARKVDRLVNLRKQSADLLRQASDIVAVLLRTKGGESRRFLARLVRMPRKVVVVRAHTQVRTYRRPAPRSDGG
jgi:hypothetical protein